MDSLFHKTNLKNIPERLNCDDVWLLISIAATIPHMVTSSCWKAFYKIPVENKFSEINHSKTSKQPQKIKGNLFFDPKSFFFDPTFFFDPKSFFFDPATLFFDPTPFFLTLLPSFLTLPGKIEEKQLTSFSCLKKLVNTLRALSGHWKHLSKMHFAQQSVDIQQGIIASPSILHSK